MNFPGNRAWTIYPNSTPMVDAGQRTKNVQTGIARGGTVEDYNAKLRGLGQRIDKKPPRPYP